MMGVLFPPLPPVIKKIYQSMRCFSEGKVNKTWEINNIHNIHRTNIAP